MVRTKIETDGNEGGDSLEAIFQLQREYVGMLDLQRYPTEVEKRISSLCVAIIHEAVELQRMTSWKWWKKVEEFDIDHAKEELVDLWHFIVQASAELGMGPSDILHEYRRKNEVNRERERKGY
ncbi:MAG: dUTPase [Nitrososphaerales archaeon]